MEENPLYATILVGTDGSDPARHVVSHAIALARSFGSALHVVTAWQPMLALALSGQLAPATPMPMDDGAWITELHERISKQGAADGVTVTAHAVEGTVAHAILDVAAEVGADLIVLGNDSLHGLRGHLASVPSSVAHKAPCAVLLVPTH